MNVVASSHHHVLFDQHLPPVLRVLPGEQLTIETIDACYGEVRSIEDYFVYRNKSNPPGNPITGPIYVEGAQPGGTLIVDILNIELDAVGFQLIGPDRGIVCDEVPEWDCYPVRVDNRRLSLPRGMVLPVSPVVGTLGNAPAGEPTNKPNRLGGNLDVPEIGTGVRVYLPIEVEGALFSLGDVHARQGDGEIVGAPEIGARVTVCFEVLEHQHAAWPMIEDDTNWATITCAENEAEAIRRGVFESARFIARNYDIRFNDALVLLTMTVRLTCARTGNWAGLEPVVCTAFSKAAVKDATASYVRPQ